MMSKEQNIAVQPKIALDDLLTRCTDYDDMSLSMDAGELKALKQHISLLESSASTELLSLREQLAEQREPVVPSTIKISEVVAAVSLEQNRKWNGRVGYMAGWNACRDAILFTAAKPKALPRHIFSMLVNELRDVPAIGCKRELIVGVLNRHGVIAEPVGD